MKKLFLIIVLFVSTLSASERSFVLVRGKPDVILRSLNSEYRIGLGVIVSKKKGYVLAPGSMWTCVNMDSCVVEVKLPSGDIQECPAKPIVFGGLLNLVLLKVEGLPDCVEEIEIEEGRYFGETELTFLGSGSPHSWQLSKRNISLQRESIESFLFTWEGVGHVHGGCFLHPATKKMVAFSTNTFLDSRGSYITSDMVNLFLSSVNSSISDPSEPFLSCSESKDNKPVDFRKAKTLFACIPASKLAVLGLYSQELDASISETGSEPQAQMLYVALMDKEPFRAGDIAKYILVHHTGHEALWFGSVPRKDKNTTIKVLRDGKAIELKVDIEQTRAKRQTIRCQGNLCYEGDLLLNKYRYKPSLVELNETPLEHTRNCCYSMSGWKQRCCKVSTLTGDDLNDTSVSKDPIFRLATSNQQYVCKVQLKDSFCHIVKNPGRLKAHD